MPGKYSQTVLGQVPDDESFCIDCPRNSFSDPGSTTPLDCECERGFTSTECTECDAGKYKNFEGQNECLDCPRYMHSLVGAANLPKNVRVSNLGHL